MNGPFRAEAEVLIHFRYPGLRPLYPGLHPGLTEPALQAGIRRVCRIWSSSLKGSFYQLQAGNAADSSSLKGSFYQPRAKPWVPGPPNNRP